MNFIAPFSFPLFIDGGSQPAFCDFCSCYLKRGREDEFYSLWLCCSPQRASAPPSTVSSSATLPLSLLYTEMWKDFYLLWPLFCPQHRPLATSLPLSLPFVTVNKEKINFTAPSHWESGTALISEMEMPYIFHFWWIMIGFYPNKMIPCTIYHIHFTILMIYYYIPSFYIILLY